MKKESAKENFKNKELNIIKQITNVFDKINIFKLKIEYEKYTNYENILSNARATSEYYILLILSCLIATLGLFQNSSAVIIGAMLLAPLMGPILGISASVLWGSMNDLWSSIWTLFKGAFLAIMIAAILAFFFPFMAITSEIMARTNPNFADVFIALFSGFIGAYAFVNKKISETISGVAIAVALMPPLSVVGIGLGLSRPEIAYGAFILFLINLVGISFAAVIVFYIVKLCRSLDDTDAVKKRFLAHVLISIISLAAIISVLVVMGHKVYQKDIRQEIIKNTLEVNTGNKIFDLNIDERAQVIEAIMLGENNQSIDAVEKIKQRLESKLQRSYKVKLFLITSAK